MDKKNPFNWWAPNMLLLLAVYFAYQGDAFASGILIGINWLGFIVMLMCMKMPQVIAKLRAEGPPVAIELMVIYDLVFFSALCGLHFWVTAVVSILTSMIQWWIYAPQELASE